MRSASCAFGLGSLSSGLLTALHSTSATLNDLLKRSTVQVSAVAEHSACACGSGGATVRVVVSQLEHSCNGAQSMLHLSLDMQQEQQLNKLQQLWLHPHRHLDWPDVATSVRTVLLRREDAEGQDCFRFRDFTMVRVLHHDLLCLLMKEHCVSEPNVVVRSCMLCRSLQAAMLEGC